MDIRFQPNNTHWLDASQFAKTDPHLRRLYQERYIYRSPLLHALPWEQPGIVTFGGSRQIGKSTLLKQWMETLLQRGVKPKAICFYSGELVGDYQSLYHLIQQQLAEMPADALKYFILDEITYIPGWDKTIKYLADIGAFEKTLVVLSGSDLVLMQDARKRFPGRRGKAPVVDFHYYPLSFKEFLQLKGIWPQQEEVTAGQWLTRLYDEFDQYLIHGGFLTAINDFAVNQSISPATLATYSDWVRGDVLKRHKKEVFLQEIMGAIIKYYMKQVSWDNLVKELSIDHTQTVADYMELLASMDAVFVQAAIIEDKLMPAPKKRKKLMFTDPFIFHAMSAWLTPSHDPYHELMKPLLSDPEHCADLVEACVATHYRRFFPTYYIKAEGEVDIAYVDKKRFWPVEVKWTNQLRPKDLKQIRKYNNSKIVAKVQQQGDIDGIPVMPLPLALLEIDIPLLPEFAIF